MRQLFRFASIAGLGILAGFGMADVASGHGLTPIFYECAGFVGACLAGAADLI
jgi:hypothetical protein